ncbi:MAG: hypothetical protein RLZZ282_430 [Verrucomicrobiota bacterium]|jgi:hypothetical protein
MPVSDWNRPVQRHGRNSDVANPAMPDRMDEVNAVCRVLWAPGTNYSREPDSAFFILFGGASERL